MSQMNCTRWQIFWREKGSVQRSREKHTFLQARRYLACSIIHTSLRLHCKASFHVNGKIEWDCNASKQLASYQVLSMFS